MLNVKELNYSVERFAAYVKRLEHVFKLHDVKLGKKVPAKSKTL